MANAYGLATLQALFPDTLESETLSSLRETMQKSLVMGKDFEGNSTFQWDVGLDARIMMVIDHASENTRTAFFPMLSELHGVMAYGNYEVYGSISARKFGNSPSDMGVYSRHHWVKYQPDENLSIRAGRMVIPFGIRIDDHTTYTRRDLGFDKHDHSYGIQLDYFKDNLGLTAMGYGGNFLVGDPSQQRRGAALTFSYFVPAFSQFGISLLGDASQRTTRFMGGAFVRTKIYEKIYAMMETDLLNTQTNDATLSQTEIVGFLRLGWFPWEWLDTHLETRVKFIQDTNKLNRFAYVAGATWQILPWIELTPQFRIIHSERNPTEYKTLLQMHLVY